MAGSLAAGILSDFYFVKTSSNLNKSVYIKTVAAISLAVDITRIPVYLDSGYLDSQFYYYIPILLVLAILGSLIDKKLSTDSRKKHSEKSF
jgi:hypothetical protein